MAEQNNDPRQSQQQASAEAQTQLQASDEAAIRVQDQASAEAQAQPQAQTEGSLANSHAALDLYIALSRASQWVIAHADRDIRQNGLNRTEFGVLELLYHKGPQPLQQIGGKVLMSSGNITYVVDKLEQKGLVRRRASKEDRRLIYAEVTDEGSAFIEKVFPGHTTVIEAALAGLSTEEQQLAEQLLKKLGKYAQQSFK